jgi:enterochelin esterase-like enzyme
MEVRMALPRFVPPLLFAAICVGCGSGQVTGGAHDARPGGPAGAAATAGATGAAGDTGVAGTGGGAPGGGGGEPVPDGGAAGTGAAGAPADAGPETLAPPPDTQMDAGGNQPEVSSEGDGVFVINGPYKGAPELTRAAGVPAGKLVRFTIPSGTSKIYPNAIDRKIAVYVPAQYKTGRPAPAMVFQDGTDFYGFDGTIPPVLDNLVAKGDLPPLVGVFVGNGGGDYIGSERGLEYDTVSGLYAQWVDTELFPRVETETKAQLPAQAVTITKDPEGRGAMGGSSGGAASFSMAWWRPDLFRKVLTFSGTYVSQVPASSPFPHGAWIYHDEDPYDPAAPNGLIVASCESAAGPKTTGAVEPCDTPLSKAACEATAGCRWNSDRNKPLRVWLEAGSNDNGASGAPSTYRNFHLANQRMAAALLARGYHVHFDDAQGAGHVDQGPLRQTLPSALRWLWRGYGG